MDSFTSYQHLIKRNQVTLKSILNLSHENKDKAKEYLASRKLDYFGDVGYILHAEFSGQHISNSLVIPVYSPLGDLVLLDTKNLSNGDYMKLTEPESKYTPIHNLDSVVKHRIVTEGVLNAETIRQCTKGYTVSSTLRASMNAKTYHILAASVTDTIITAFDNDPAGQEATKTLMEFFKEFYPNITIKILDFNYNDLNLFLIKHNKSVVGKHIDFQLSKYKE